MSEKRKRTRILVNADIVLRSEDKAFSLYGRTRDISMKGLFIKSVGAFPLGAKCHIEIIIHGHGSDLTIKLCGNVARIENGGYGVLFDNDLEFWPMLVILKPSK